jgi:hypothetical protein
VAALTPLGPHVTPMVFAVGGGRVWVTTSRGSVKARAWRSDPRVAGMVRAGEDAVAFTGRARTHDLLDPASWARSVVEGPVVSAAAARFTRKNARFFAGYAVDARRVPLAWTPPGRVFVELSIDRAALLEAERPPRTWGDWGDAVPSAERFRRAGTGGDPLGSLPPEIRTALGNAGHGALALEAGDGPVVVPIAWAAAGSGLYAVAPPDAMALADPASPSPRAAMGIDRPSSWRARDMVGVMARGVAELYASGALASGASSARAVARAAGRPMDDVVVARIRPARLVWWRGWDSGTVVT